MSYFVDSAMGSPVPHSVPRPAVARQGPVNTCEDPRMTYGFQFNYHQQRPLYPFWDETATQEVPTGLEHCVSDGEEFGTCDFRRMKHFPECVVCTFATPSLSYSEISIGTCYYKIPIYM